ncbi:MAG: prepilin-type N-terminal cleavage/methylation domain-containing protein [Deefgea sp.]
MKNLMQLGFSLVEMAVVLVVVGILMASLMGPITAQLDYQRSREAKRFIADSKEAILGFILRNKRLPCPAKANLAEDDAKAGTEDCAFFALPANLPPNPTSYGVLPWVDLGLPQLDPWGRRYRYAVTGTFSDATPGVASTGGCTSSIPTTGASFSWCMAGDKDIKGIGGVGIVANKVVVVVLSHGKNGLGGFDSAGNQLLGAAGDELENANGDNIFISTGITDEPVFDDLIDWIAPPIIFNRMVAAGLLP